MKKLFIIFMFFCLAQVLLKLIKLHDLPGVILEWRKLDNSVSKKICPLLNAYEHHPGLSMARIYSVCKTFNVNGRVYLKEPNIQNVPNDFEVIATPELIRKALGQNESVNNKSELLLSYASILVDLPQDEESYKVSLRNAFVASESCMIIAGIDEMRTTTDNRTIWGQLKMLSAIQPKENTDNIF